jgi:hypothetical protein
MIMRRIGFSRGEKFWTLPSANTRGIANGVTRDREGDVRIEILSGRRYGNGLGRREAFP